jgi:ATP-dependent exoDNAse (exonuclease V) beta subunit
MEQFREKWVESQPISLPGHLSTSYIKGKFDTVVRFEDGSYGVVDFKTSTSKPTHLAF